MDLLAPWVPDAEDRAFVVRCMLDEGPAHHRGANYVLLALLGRLVEAIGATGPKAGRSPARSVPMRLPPHLAPADDEDGDYPLPLPTAGLAKLAPEGSVAFEAMVDCLTDGPPQHALANAAMVCLVTAALERLDAGRGPGGEEPG